LVSHATFYNRVGYALLFLIMFEHLGAPRFTSADNSVVETSNDKELFCRGMSTEAVLTATFLVKVYFFPPAGSHR
jgi:hypothetical protein